MKMKIYLRIWHHPEIALFTGDTLVFNDGEEWLVEDWHYVGSKELRIKSRGWYFHARILEE